MCNKYRLIRFDITDGTFRQVDIHVHPGIIHNTHHRFSLFYPHISRVMRQIDNNTVERSLYIHLFQIDPGILEVITGIRHFHFGITHFTQGHTAFFIKGFLFRLFLFCYFQTQFLGIYGNTVLIFLIFQMDNQLSFRDQVAQFERSSCLRVDLEFVQTAHFRVKIDSIRRLCRPGRVNQFTDRTFFQFRYRNRCGYIAGRILRLVVTTGCYYG